MVLHLNMHYEPKMRYFDPHNTNIFSLVKKVGLTGYSQHTFECLTVDMT